MFNGLKSASKKCAETEIECELIIKLVIKLILDRRNYRLLERQCSIVNLRR
jgi:hypothetical protein